MKKKAKKPVCIDLFAGCGGLSLGLEQAGFEPILCCEINKDAQATYRVNRKQHEVAYFSDIDELTPEELASLKKAWTKTGCHDVDLVCGGPPCQGYSGIGHRRTFNLHKKEIPSNHYYKAMVSVIRHVSPRMFLFENVRGLLFSRWTRTGVKGEIFRDVITEFSSIPNYSVRWSLVRAKDYGVPQNRPRVLIVGIRNDVLTLPQPQLADGLPLPTAVEDGLLPQPSGAPPDLVDALGDLIDSRYLGKSETTAYTRDPSHPFQIEMRTTPEGMLLKKGAPLTEQEYSDHSDDMRFKFQWMIDHDGEIPEKYRTKKFAQKVLPKRWGESGPSITATSMPDDYIHYSQARILTVREWARLQTFPDWYVFTGSRTTGGRRRAGDPSIGAWERDVPKYTQIGNAVPVRLARAVGVHLAGLLSA